MVPAVLTAAWQADDGDIALAMASITDERLSIPLEFDPRAYGLTGPGSINRIDEKGIESIGEFGGGPVAMTLEVPALGAWLIEFSSRTEH
jgi:hypothetical protein